MKATKFTGLIVEAENGEKVLFGKNGEELVNLSKYHESLDLMYNLWQCCVPEDEFGKCCRAWAGLLLEEEMTKEEIKQIPTDRTIFQPKVKSKTKKNEDLI